MDFQKIPNIEDKQHYLDVAFRRGASKAKAASKNKDVVRISTVKDYLVSSLGRIITSFPSFDDLSLFHRDVLLLRFEIDDIKQSLGGLNWAMNTVRRLGTEYTKKSGEWRQFYARANSVFVKVEKDLLFLEEVRRFLREMPMVREMFTSCITGFPNVGKSTLITRMTEAKPEVNSYAFTTKRINIGYFDNIQVMDTPGALGREKVNSIEQLAFYAIKDVADVLVFVFDLTEPYPWEDQLALFEKMKGFDKPMLGYVSKTDVIDVDDRVKELDLELFTDYEELKEKLRKMSKNHTF